MNVLEIIGIVFAVLAAIVFLALLLILVALCIKISLSANFGEEKKLIISYLFVKKQIYPSVSDPAKKEESAASASEHKKADKSETKKKKSKKSLGFSFDDYIEILGLFNKNVIKKLFFDRLFVYVSVGTPDADKTALNYGRLSAAVAPVVNGLQSAGKIKRGEVRICPDFASPDSSFSADVSLSFIPIFILPLVFGVLKIYFRTKKNSVKRG